MSDDVVAVLQKAKERVAEGWCQGYYASAMSDDAALQVYTGDANCLDVFLSDFPDARVCMEGALWACTQVAGCLQRAEEALRQAVSSRFLPDWNDHPDRTQAEVLDAFDAAIRLAKDAA